ncbi:MAG: hypothetical protein HZB98_11745 [Bacteroidia bacterium]|nr:hypothetical protein [Bacteroidia bacterium]
MNSIIQYFKEIIQGVGSLLKGMRVTNRYFFSPGKIVTQKYPNNRKDLVLFERFAVFNRALLIKTLNKPGSKLMKGVE